MNRLLQGFIVLNLFAASALALNIAHENAVISRRQFSIHSSAFLGAVSSASPSNAAATQSQTSSSIASRLKSDIITAPAITAGTRYTGHEKLYFPDWLEGEWDCTQTLLSTKAPLGLSFVGGPQGSLDVAETTMSEQRKRLNEPVELKLRFFKTNFGVVEDRAFNLRSRLNSFAGRDVVASVEYADVRESNRASVLAAGGAESDPLSTTLVYFKGPAAQKTFVISHGEDPLDSDAWSGFELERSIFALTNKNTAPPVTTIQRFDTHLIEFGVTE